MFLASWLSSAVSEAAWLGAGVLLGASLVVFILRVQAQREASGRLAALPQGRSEAKAGAPAA